MHSLRQRIRSHIRQLPRPLGPGPLSFRWTVDKNRPHAKAAPKLHIR